MPARADRRLGWVAAVLPAVAAYLLLQVLLRGTYWEYSEGVYLETARLFVHGAGLYDDVVAAQTPPVFLVGAAALGVHESLGTVRAAVGALELVAAVLAARLAWRLTGARAAAAATAVLFLLTPWTLREHGALIPETLAPALLLAGVLLAGRERAGVAVGVLAGLLAFVKLPLLLPAAALVLVARERRRALVAAAVTLAAALAISALAFGSALWTDVVRAQLQTGRAGLGDLGGVWAQAAWNEVGLVPGLVLAFRFRGALEPRLLRAAAVVAAATAVTFVSTAKLGTSLYVLVPVEAMTLPLSVAGGTAALRSRAVPWAAIGLLGVAFALAQSLALLAHPRVTASHPFLRPGSAPRYGINLTRPQLASAAAVARRCPPGAPYSGPPFVAFVARRPMPAGQPDPFLADRAPALAAVDARIKAVAQRCPATPPPIP